MFSNKQQNQSPEDKEIAQIDRYLTGKCSDKEREAIKQRIKSDNNYNRIVWDRFNKRGQKYVFILIKMIIGCFCLAILNNIYHNTSSAILDFNQDSDTYSKEVFSLIVQLIRGMGYLLGWLAVTLCIEKLSQSDEYSYYTDYRFKSIIHMTLALYILIFHL